MKRNCSVRKRCVSGFTLLEMVIVLGIISILLGVLVPTMRTYMTKSRQNTANSNAKVIFNSLQTIMQEYEFSERGQEASLFYGAAKKGNVFLYCTNGDINMTRCSFTNNTGTTVADHALPSDAATLDAAIGASYSSAGAKSLGARMGRLYTDYQSVTWYALIQDYSVAAVICAASPQASYMGGYPLSVTEKNLHGVGTLDVSSMGTITAADLTEYAEVAWNMSKVY